MTASPRAEVPGPERPLRADAVRNRDKLLDVAVRAFTEDGVDVPLETIANRAGVGVGTLYRHFPNRNALVQAVYRHEVERLCESPDALLADNPTDVALQQWMERFVDYAVTKRGMSEALSSAVASGLPLFANTRSQMIAALSTLIAAAVALTQQVGRRPATVEEARTLLGASVCACASPSTRTRHGRPCACACRCRRWMSS